MNLVKKYCLVKISNYLKNNNFSNELYNINNGSIIFIDDNLTLENYKILLEYLYSKDLKIVYLSELIQE